MTKWTPKDCVAVLVIIVAGMLLYKGIDTVVGFSLLAVVAGYYGIAIPSLIKVIKQARESKEDK